MAGSFYKRIQQRPFVLVLRDTSALIVPALVYFEVTKRARQLFGKALAEKIEGLLQGGIFIEVTRGVTARAINASLEYKLAIADSLIYATAL